MGLAEYCFWSLPLTYILFYFSFFIAFLVSVLILDDDNECNELKKFGIAQLVADIFLTFFICLAYFIGFKIFVIIWFIVHGSFHWAGLFIYDGSNCTQTLRELLFVYLYASLLPTAITAIATYFYCCHNRENPSIKPEPQPKKEKRYEQRMMPFWQQQQVTE